MKRRCAFLDNLPAFNFNTGVGEPIVGDNGHISRTDTRHLGSTLMETMLDEVSHFCDPSIRKNWRERPHHQVNNTLISTATCNTALMYMYTLFY